MNKHLFLHSVIISYLIMIVAALCYTLFRFELFPAESVLPFYGTMAPFQGYTTMNTELAAEGRIADGVWQEIDLHQYIPAGQGEFAYRGYMLTVKAKAHDPDELYRLFTEKLLRAEHARGNNFDEIRLLKRMWPVTAEGYYTLNTPASRVDDILFTLP